MPSWISVIVNRRLTNTAPAIGTIPDSETSPAVVDTETADHYNDVIMSAMASQITSLTIVYSTVYLGADKKESKLRVTGVCVGNSPVRRKMFPFDAISCTDRKCLRNRYGQHEIPQKHHLG